MEFDELELLLLVPLVLELLLLLWCFFFLVVVWPFWSVCPELPDWLPMVDWSVEEPLPMVLCCPVPPDWPVPDWLPWGAVWAHADMETVNNKAVVATSNFFMTRDLPLPSWASLTVTAVYEHR